MNFLTRSASIAALAAAVFFTTSPAFAQRGRGYGGLGYGLGYGGLGYGGYGYSSAYSGYSPSYSYSSGYASAPANATQTVAAPYLTSQTYEPGDGYRYPLYYNPATGTYIYYPLSR